MEKENKDFEELVRDLNSLLEKIPDMIGKPEEKISKMDEKDQEADNKSDTELQNLSDIENFIITPQASDVKNKDVDSSAKKLEDNQQVLDIDNEEEKKKDDVNETLNHSADDIKLEPPDEMVIHNEDINQFSDEIKTDIQVEQSPIISPSSYDIELDKSEEKDKDEKSFEILDSHQKEKEFSVDIQSSFFEEEHQIQCTEKQKDFNNLLLSDELKDIIYAKKPSDVSDERVKKIGLVCSINGETVLKHFLRYLDEICFSSKNKKMFVERSFVLFYDENFSVENLIINAGNEKVNAVVLIGEIPVDKVYEIKNAVSQAGYIFFSFSMKNLSRSEVIDFVLDLIAGSV